jgi:hypothetical protein
MPRFNDFRFSRRCIALHEQELVPSADQPVAHIIVAVPEDEHIADAQIVGRFQLEHVSRHQRRCHAGRGHARSHDIP